MKRTEGELNFPGPNSPGWVQTAEWIIRPLPFLDKCMSRFGPVFSLNLTGWAKHIIVAQPDLIEAVMRAAPDQLLTGAANEIMRPVLGPASLFLLDGDPHRHQRRYLLEATSRERLDDAILTADGAVEKAIDQAASEGWIDAVALAKQISMRYTLSLVFGATGPSHASELVRLFEEVLGPATTVLAFANGVQRYTGPHSPWAWALKSLTRVRKTIGELTNQATEISSGVPCAAQLLHTYVDANGRCLTREAIIDQTLSLIIAGFDTTATSMAWTAAWLLDSPSVNEQLLGIAPQQTRDNYAEAICLEALRLYPTIEIVSRTPSSVFFLDSVPIKSGTLISPCIYLVHNNPAIYPKPSSFDPSRFIERKPAPWEFFPFGLSGRSCIGGAFAIKQMQAFVNKLFIERKMISHRAAPPRPSRRHVTIEPRGPLRVGISRRQT
jgi:cytochrome P450 family 110